MKYSPIIVMSMMLFPLMSLSDGGILSIKTLPPDDESTEWAMDKKLYSTMDNLIDIHITGGETHKGYLICSPVNGIIRHSLSMTDPIQYGCDVNGDTFFGRYDANELTEGKPEKINRPNRQNQFIFRNAPYPSFYGSIPNPLTIDVRCWEELDPFPIGRRVELVRCKTVYDGTIALQDQTYAARLIFRSLEETPIIPNYCIVLDTNRDGRFHPLDDSWFSGDWYASIENRLWTVKTTFNGSTVEVILEPYEGPTGTLQLQGRGIARVCIGKPYGTPTINNPRFNDPNPRFEMTVSLRNDWSAILPVGDYVFSTIILKSKQNDGVYYQWPTPLQPIEYTPFQLEENQVYSAWVGGPIYDRIKVKKILTYDDLCIYFEGTFNDQYYPFIENGYDHLFIRDIFPSFSWILTDSRGNTIQTGPFTNQVGIIYMPFFQSGTFQIQREGADNDLLIRTITEIRYWPQRLIILGISLLFFGILFVFLIRIDRTYSWEKIWVLVPGMMGVFWIVNFTFPFDPFLNNPEAIVKLAGTGPFGVTCILIACRGFLPTRIPTVFFTTFSTCAATFLAVSFLFEKAILLFFLILSLLYTLQFLAFYLCVKGKPRGWRIWMGYGIGCGIPTLLYAIAVLIDGDQVEWMMLVITFFYFNVLMIPLSLLTAWNRWVRDLFGKMLIEQNPRPIHEPDKTQWAA